MAVVLLILLLHVHLSEMTVVQVARCTRECAGLETQSHGVTLTVLWTVCRSTPYPGMTRGNTSCRGRMTLFWSSATHTTKRSVGMLIGKDAAHSNSSTQPGRCLSMGVSFGGKEAGRSFRIKSCTKSTSVDFFLHLSLLIKLSVQIQPPPCPSLCSWANTQS